MQVSVVCLLLLCIIATTVTDCTLLMYEDLQHLHKEAKTNDVLVYKINPTEIKLEVEETADLKIEASGPVPSTKLLCVHFNKLNGSRLVDRPEPESVVSSDCAVLYKPADESLPAQALGIIRIQGQTVGTETLHLYTSDDPKHGIDQVTVHVVRATALTVLGDIIGWVYFIAWSLSFYPQIIENYSKKSVKGMNFDFCAINLIGYWSYSFFNIGLFFVLSVQEMYLSAHPGGVIPVRINDVFFALHQTLMITTIVMQILFYDRAGQSVSKMACGLVSALLLFIIVSFVLDLTNIISWLTFLYFLSYIKLICTVIMFIPQVYMNFQRKSTAGWSIYMVWMIFIGGSGSVIQMLLLAYNNDDWSSVSGNLAKLCLGLVSVFFSVIFLIQHFCVYKTPRNAYETEHEHAGKNPKAIEAHNECTRAAPVAILFM
jgi:cystinosin